MPEVIKIGTRDSKLALWQASVVQQQLEALGHQTALVPVKATGDLTLDKPLYELGITGVFTRTLDVAMLNKKIDIAVHSFKDVPTTLPQGIVQAAVLKRGNVSDTLVYKDNEEFLSAQHATIATSSLRRKAQWLNRYPTHTVENLRGNVNSRLEKLKNTPHWHAAIFAAAGIGRVGIRPETAINLSWMVPAPAQGAIMITALEARTDILQACAELNHEETEICTHIERTFLNTLEGGCTAPIGALAQIKGEDIHFKGILLSPNGSKKIEVTRSEKLGSHHNMGVWCANYIIERGGKRLMDTIKKKPAKPTVFATKKMTQEQQLLFRENVVVQSADFIKINPNRIPRQTLRGIQKNVIITSKNAVESLEMSSVRNTLQFENIYCVGRRTKRLIEQRIGPVKHVENNAQALANYLVEMIEGTEATYLCGNLRRDDISQILRENHIKVHEIEVYQTRLEGLKIPDSVTHVLFFSPSGVTSFVAKNSREITALCIGETTANVARKHFKTVRVSKIPTIESVIALANESQS